MKKKVYIVDAFTDKPFEGNPAGVILDADGLNPEQMQQMAKEINLSETAFIFTSDDADADFRVRYFTPSLEIDFCGHATIALSWILISIGLNKGKLPVVLKTNIGIIPIDAVYESHKLIKVVMTQVEPKTKPFEDDSQELCWMIGIRETDIDGRYPLGLAYTGNWHLLVPVKTRAAIDRAVPDYEALAKHNRSKKISTTHLFTFDSGDSSFLLYTRDFAPSSGVPEDPVTGSANGALAGFLALKGLVPEKEYQILQGNSRNRPGKLYIKVNDDNKKVSIQVGGGAVVVIEGYIGI